MKNIIQSKFRWVYWIGFFIILALPLLNLPPWFSPPDWGKTIIFRSILAVLLFIFLWQILNNRGRASVRFSGKVKIGLFLLLGLLGIYFLATVFSLDRNFSLWGSPYRSGGFINFAFYIFFAIFAFLILQEQDWQKIWDFAIFIGILVSVIAILQWQGLFEDILITFENRPPSTIGGPIFLGIYLLLLSFLTLSFGIREKKIYKKIFYFSSLLLFIFVILLTYTRAAFLGLFIGILYFIFFYPSKKISISVGLRFATLILLVLVACGIYYANTTAELPRFIEKNELLKGAISRISIKGILQNPRVSGWKVSWQALKDRPILGFGPENFSIGFDRYYDPSLPKIEMMPGGVSSWWDRAHSFVFDISISAGIPALIIYITLFGFLFRQLQRLKKGGPDQSLICHGIQATFWAYLVANSFSFDVFSTYLISFLLIGYSLTLINLSTKPGNVDNSRGTDSQRLQKLRRYKGVILFLLFVGLVWFVWSFNIKPFQINTEINLAKYESGQGHCKEALEIMGEVLPEKTYLDHYSRMKYVEIIKECIEKKPEGASVLVLAAIDILKENIKIRPYYTRSWVLLGNFTNIQIENAIRLGEKVQSQSIQELKTEANQFFEKGHQLSPQRLEVLTGWIRTDFLTEEYQSAKQKSQECIDLNPELGECWWYKGVSQIYLGEIKEGEKSIEIAKSKKYPTKSTTSLLQLAEAYSKNKKYEPLIDIYRRLINREPENPQYHASLAYVYKNLREFEKAKKEALKVLELAPEFREEVEEFLRSLPE